MRSSCGKTGLGAGAKTRRSQKLALMWRSGPRRSRRRRQRRHPPILRKRVSDDGEDRGRSHARPGHHEGEADKYERPRRAKHVDHIAERGQTDEDQERAAASEAISEPPARILVDRVEEI